MNLLLRDTTQGKLPNILFDTTLQNKKKITDSLPHLIEAGYDPRDIHIVWVLTDYAVAIKQNRSRSRIVPDDIMLKTHEGAARTMFDMIRTETPRGVDGSVHIALGGKKNTVLYTDASGKPIKTGNKKDTIVVKDFSYLTMKQPGKAMNKDKILQKQAFAWSAANAPRTLKIMAIPKI